MKKKLFSLVIVMLAFAVVGTPFSENGKIAYASETMPEKFSEAYYQNVDRSIEVFAQAMGPYRAKTTTADGTEIVEYHDNFAGVFIDDAGYLNIAVVSRIEGLPSFDGQVIYRQFTYSYNLLYETYEMLTAVMENYAVYMVAIQENYNQVSVYFNKNNEKQIVAYLQEKNLYYESAVNLVFDPDGHNVADANTIRGGERLCTQTLGIPSWAGTLSVNAYDNTTGEYGVLTNKHVAENDTLYADGWFGAKIGKASKSQLSGNIDAAFILNRPEFSGRLCFPLMDSSVHQHL